MRDNQSTLMGCGHPTSAIESGAGGTTYCRDCQEEGSRNWIRSERARTLRWLAGQIESGERRVEDWTVDDLPNGERFTLTFERREAGVTT